jgi:hypothetical protein
MPFYKINFDRNLWPATGKITFVLQKLKENTFNIDRVKNRLKAGSLYA